jgi:hypothetical protein
MADALWVVSNLATHSCLAFAGLLREQRLADLRELSVVRTVRVGLRIVPDAAARHTLRVLVFLASASSSDVNGRRSPTPEEEKALRRVNFFERIGFS